MPLVSLVSNAEILCREVGSFASITNWLRNLSETDGERAEDMERYFWEFESEDREGRTTYAGNVVFPSPRI